jgi:non-ribosomal peptide synthetase component F
VAANHASFSFGISVYDIYATLFSGACVAIIPSAMLLSPKHCLRFIEKNKITHWYSVPSALQRICDEPDFKLKAQKSLQCIITAGEPLPRSLANKILEALPQARLFNFYGASETNVSTYFEVTEPLPASLPNAPIGKAVPHCKVTTKKRPNGLEELTVQGDSVMLGYWGDDFTTDLIYHTGDIVEKTKNGSYVFVNRVRCSRSLNS